MCNANAQALPLASKIKVSAIVYELSLPRIELEAAKLGILVKRLVAAYDEIECEVYLQSDSMMALGWEYEPLVTLSR